jgi:uncharacterized membrane protein YoaK (UPF0700 family)
MTSYDRRAQVLAFTLAVLAGYVDASGFMAVGGFFVSFMSGNSTRMAIGLAQGSDSAGIAAGLICAFLFGVMVGALAGHVARGRRRSIVLALVAALLAAGAASSAAGAVGAAVTFMAMAMGAENNVFERNGEVSIGLTYMTGSLVKLGQRIVGGLLGTDRLGWLPYLYLWLSFVLGAVGGAAAYPHVGLSALWGAALVAALLALATWSANPGTLRQQAEVRQPDGTDLQG